MANIAYVRVSSNSQNTDRQYADFDVAGIKIDKVFEDKRSGKDMSRDGLQKMLEYVREGDVIYVESVSRLGRSLPDLLMIVDKLKKKNVQLCFLKESIDTTTAQGTLIFNIFGALSQFERECIKERQAEGIAAAKAAGKRLGRPSKTMPKGFPTAYKDWKSGKATAAATWRMLGLTKSTFYKLAKKYEENTDGRE